MEKSNPRNTPQPCGAQSPCVANNIGFFYGLKEN